MLRTGIYQTFTPEILLTVMSWPMGFETGKWLSARRCRVRYSLAYSESALRLWKYLEVS